MFFVSGPLPVSGSVFLRSLSDTCALQTLKMPSNRRFTVRETVHELRLSRGNVWEPSDTDDPYVSALDVSVNDRNEDDGGVSDRTRSGADGLRF